MYHIFTCLFNWTGVIDDLEVEGRSSRSQEICLVANKEQTAGVVVPTNSRTKKLQQIALARTTFQTNQRTNRPWYKRTEPRAAAKKALIRAVAVGSERWAGHARWRRKKKSKEWVQRLCHRRCMHGKILVKISGFSIFRVLTDYTFGSA